MGLKTKTNTHEIVQPEDEPKWACPKCGAPQRKALSDLECEKLKDEVTRLRGLGSAVLLATKAVVAAIELAAIDERVDLGKLHTLADIARARASFCSKDEEG
jgi:hypothetical protein